MMMQDSLHTLRTANTHSIPTCFLIHHVLLTAAKSDAVKFKLGWMPLAERALRLPEKRKLFFVTFLNGSFFFGGHYSNS